jgi:hypothetical protein
VKGAKVVPDDMDLLGLQMKMNKDVHGWDGSLTLLLYYSHL